MPLKLLFKVSSRSRPSRLFETLDSIVNNLSNKEDYSIQLTADEDDITMNNKEVIDRLHSYKKLTYYFGESKNKIDAINKNIEKFPKEWDVLLNVSDDQKFLAYGFDDIIRSEFKELGGTDWFVHFPDSRTGAQLCTMSIFGKEYFDRTKRIYHESFESVYADNFAMEEAKKVGKYVFVNKFIMDHFHPRSGLAAWDEQYKKTEHPEVYARDKTTFNKLILELT